MTVPNHPLDCRVEEQLDVSRLLDPLGQIAGHVLIEIIAANQEQHLAGVLGKVNGGLACRVAAAHQYHLGPLAHLHLSGSRSVIDTLPLEPLAPLDAQPTVVGSSGDQETLCCDGLAAV